MIEFGECLSRLSGPDEADRIYAAEDLGYASRPEAVAPLVRRLAVEPSRAVREAIFSALQQIEAPAVIAAAVDLLDSDDAFVRNQAVDLLRSRGGAALPFLDRAFADGDSRRRKLVVDVLAGIEGTGAGDIYERALADSDINVVITAVESAGEARKADLRERILALISPEAHPMLLASCLETLVQIGDAVSLAVLRERLRDSLTGFLEPSYLKLLGALGDETDAVEIARAMRHDHLKAEAVSALTSLRGRHPGVMIPVEAAQPLEDIAADAGSPLVAYQAVRLLGALQDVPQVFEFLGRALAHPEKAVRIGAIQALRSGPAGRAGEILRARLRDETDEEVLQVLQP